MLTALHILGHRPLPARPKHAPVRAVRPMAEPNPAELPPGPPPPRGIDPRRIKAQHQRDEIVAYMREVGRPITRTEIADLFDLEYHIAGDRLSELRRQRIAQSTRSGNGRTAWWSLTEAGK